MPPKFSPPANWRQLYTRMASYRKDLVAPVDTIGCSSLVDRTAPMETQRFHILVALMLSSQTKDPVTAAAMHLLMEAGLTPQSVAAMPPATLDGYICKVGFHNNKTKYIKEVAGILLRDFSGRVPREYEQVIALPGVGPKMAHLFFQAADGRVLGIGVDTHVHRISQRFKMVPPTVKSPEDTRKVLEAWLPKEHWADINHLMVGLGQTICTPLNPKCDSCELSDLCPNAFKEKQRLGKLDSSPPKRKRAASVDMEDLVQPRRAANKTTSPPPSPTRARTGKK